MKRLVLSVDVETTDLEAKPIARPVAGRWKVFREGAIIQLAGQLCIYDKGILHIMDTFDYKLRPHKGASLAKEAFERNGFTPEEVSQFANPVICVEKFKDLMLKHLEKPRFGKWHEKYFWLGYNHFFDKGHISELFKRFSDDSLNNFVNWHPLEVYAECTNEVFFSELTAEDTPNLQLGTYCARHNISINAHDAFSDSLATLKSWCNKNKVTATYKGLTLEMFEDWNKLVVAEDIC